MYVESLHSNANTRKGLKSCTLEGGKAGRNILKRKLVTNGVLAESLGVALEYLLIMTSFLKCHDFCRPLVPTLLIDHTPCRVATVLMIHQDAGH